MSSVEINDWLRRGVAAARAGERAKAHQLLVNVLRADEENELAWLWLSGVVETAAEQRICLENVLTLNPENQWAQRGLQKLGAPSDSSEEATAATPITEEKVLRREYTPISPAAAILYPERQVQEVRWQEPVVQQKAAQAAYRPQSSYDDVWSRNVEICAYCAHPIAEDETHCPNCNRRLSSKRFAYPEPSSHIHVYWVLLVGLGQLFLIEGIVHIIIGQNYLAAVGYGVLLLIFWGLALGVYLRQSWAHISSIIALVLVLAGFMLNALIDVDLSALGLETLDSSVRNFAGPLIRGLLDFLLIFEITTAVLALVYAVFKAGPDFERAENRLAAAVTKGRRTAGDYHNIARRLSEKGLWASAILHWQRAAAQEPGQVTYQKQLGLAYARLGFYQRSLDVLQSAYDLSSYPPVKAELAQQIQSVRQKLAAQAGDTAVNAS